MLVKLSDELTELNLNQQSDKFVKGLRIAVSKELISAAYVRERIELPKEFRYKRNSTKRDRAVAAGNSSGTYRKRVPEMIILKDDPYIQWFRQIKAELSQVQNRMDRAEEKQRGGPSAAAVMADQSREMFWKGVKATRSLLNNQEKHGRELATPEGFHSPEDGPSTKKKRSTTPKERRSSGAASSPADTADQAQAAEQEPRPQTAEQAGEAPRRAPSRRPRAKQGGTLPSSVSQDPQPQVEAAQAGKKRERKAGARRASKKSEAAAPADSDGESVLPDGMMGEGRRAAAQVPAAADRVTTAPVAAAAAEVNV